jgi:thioredoxin-related protein
MKIFTRFSFIALLFILPLALTFGQNAKTPAKKKSTAKKNTAKKLTPVKAAREIKWFKGQETDFEDSIKKWKKPAFLYIYLDNGDASASFEKTVLKDTGIINFVDSNFVAYKLNLEYDSPNAMKYMIDDVPCVILFGRKGQEIDRITGYEGKADVKKFLKKAL